MNDPIEPEPEPEEDKMQAIILAAGNGNRLRPLTDSIPKVMIEVCGETIIKRALNHLAELKKIKEVIIVVGYKAERIKEHIGKSYKDMKITYVLNKDYSSTNNMYSLWLAKDYVKNDVILLEGEKQITKKSIEVNHPLHYGGYHFYQNSYDPEKGQYTVLTVHSDSGLNMVYTGYLMLSLAVLWQFWLRHIGGYFRRCVNGD